MITVCVRQMVRCNINLKRQPSVVHEIYDEEQEYNKTHKIAFCVINAQEWLEYYRAKLAATKNLIYEAIDFFVGANNVIS